MAWENNRRDASDETPEAETRRLIDEQLKRAGWEADTKRLRHSEGTRPVKGRNLAIAEWPTDAATGTRGFADYALFVGTRMVAVLEAKAADKDVPAVLDGQGRDYASHIRETDAEYVIDAWDKYKVPFAFASNGGPYVEQLESKSGVWFLDLRSRYNTPRPLRGWPSPTGIMELLERNDAAGNSALRNLSRDFLRDKDGLNLYPFQLRAIEAAENAVMEGRRNILLAMATGTGKTRTALGLIYRFLKSGRFRRVLFLVDRNLLGEQAYEAFKEVRLESLKTLNEIYTVRGVKDKPTETAREFIDDDTVRLQIATVQSMVKRILYPEDGAPIPGVTDYDLVIADEAHRGYILDREMGETETLYRDQRDFQSKYRAVISYFDAVRIGLTATPALHTVEIFGRPVFQYTYGEAVVDGYLVDHDAPHRLPTKLSVNGIHYHAGDTVTLLNPKTNTVTDGAEVADELDFDVDDFNRNVINENFDRAVLTEIAKDLHPEAPETYGKTLIFAVNDAHADRIVTILRKIYEERKLDGEAIQKITGYTADGNQKRIEETIKNFKNERFPSVAVTVDLLSTGVDVPKITALVFMRRVKSRILFEQMLGRATRLCPEIGKDHFEIYDPVGVYDVLAPVSAMQSVAVNPQATFSDLLDGFAVMTEEGEIGKQVNQILARLQRKRRVMDERTREQFASVTGETPERFIERVRNATPPEARDILLSHADALRLLDRRTGGVTRYVVVSNAPDELLSHERGYGRGQKPEDYLEAFSAYLRENLNEITALRVLCTRPGELTRESLKQLRLTLEREGFTLLQLNGAVSRMSNQEITADIVSLIRRYAIGAELRGHEERIRGAVAKLKAAHDFTPEELRWIDRMESYLLEELVLTESTFDEDGRFRAEGGFRRIDRIFRNRLKNVLAELNGFLYDDGGESA